MMMTRTFSLVAACTLVACAADIAPQRLRLFKPLPPVMASPDNPLTPEKIDLGRMLYYENRISKSQQFSCNSCHPLDRYGVDNEATSPGHKGKRGDRNSPTSFNAAGHLAQFWDGRAADVEEQAKGPVLNPVEMAMPDEKSVVAVLTSMPEYVALFKKAFPGEPQPVTYNNMAKAIGAFERKLLTPSRWDKFLNGDKNALTAAEQDGFNKFYDAGCASCHNGPYLGGSSYQKLGLVKPFPAQHDLGRYSLTKSEHDKMTFKVPSLRNIDKTWPYFHDGSVKTLEQAIRLMGQHQTPKPLTNKEVTAIATFLNSLTGELPADYIKRPKLPASTARTPKPNTAE